ncbi:hypothetical protein INR75_19720 [Zunongwangia sp. SCSIO 43204]|uniref:DUF6371 domain-containing protein n=1 Tax=Zunongwangia sp. SCSIO 43204 TaxID=2779359 RepID=UPI001CA7CA94|nr:DUF6371 domain-containing protein [Zunongwangia sp. SCSIO 43204]UAB84353.1 hypothetical protein INR75_19720 [Zunongwangia sp. SCSIO 43204]
MEKLFKYSLDRGSKKFTCPACHRKTFVKFIDNETGSYVDQMYGRCDREQKCGYFCTPDSSENTFLHRRKESKPELPTYISLEHLDKYFNSKYEDQNNFIISLNKILDAQRIRKVVNDYFISTCFYWNNWATIFWQIDQFENVRSGQVILYNANDGKRVKKPFKHITWMHSILQKNGEIQTFNLKQCLFGLHLINDFPDKNIAIVEAPKTACIMSAVYPKFLWMATCGLSNLSPEKFKPIKEKKIILYPDLGAYDVWSEKAKALKKFGYQIEVSNLLEVKCKDYPKGLDIADFFVTPEN